MQECQCVECWDVDAQGATCGSHDVAQYVIEDVQAIWLCTECLVSHYGQAQGFNFGEEK